ncbi:BREX-2 system phosphatase PglZ [Phytohabitans kaempferiae]|uniref:BREX-2 system phosphatase PglZ n=1 Tax=Phytohabitans kaempferiae TaxID=1620943 RepID=A0ABV6MDM3_9ACTN
MTDTRAVPVATEAQVRRLAQDWLRRARDGQVLAIQARPVWNAPDLLDIGGQPVRVVACPSPLAMRAALVDQKPDERLVILTDCDEDTLGVGLLAHCAKLRPVSIEPWELVRAQFAVADLDPALVKEGTWLAEALVEHTPDQGWPPITGSVLTRGHAMRSLSATLLNVSGGDLDSAGILDWTVNKSVDVVQYAALPAWLRVSVATWLADTAGAPARWAMACVDAGNGTDAIPLGLLARLLWAPDVPLSTAVTAARARLEHLLGGTQPSSADAVAWGEAAQAWVERAVDGPDRQLVVRVLARAEEIARAVQAEALLVRSDLLPAALNARLHDFADKLRAALAKPQPAALAAVEDALRTLRRHRLAATGDRATLAEMAVRLLRWLAMPEPPQPVTLAEAVARQVTEHGWVDRARLDVWAGDPDPYVASAYQNLHAAVDARRAAHDQRFATLLSAATVADTAPGGMLRVEDVLARVVRPILDAKRRVLLLVVDGMSVSASTELVQSVAEQGWVELTPGGGPRVGVLAALPTLTQVSRASLFAGRITVGQQAEERDGLAAALGSGVRLLHKADLRAGSGASLDRNVVDALADPKLRLVAAVVNTIDDALESSEPGITEWTTQTVRAVRDLLAHAHDRIVVLLSDHGHIVDRGPEMQLRSNPTGGSRWRSADTPAGEGELLFEGPRVAFGGGRVVLPWRETVRYAPRKAGYHGGASAAEAVIPLTILSATAEDAVPGWEGAPVASPAWWRGPVAPAPEVAAVPTTPGTLFESVPVSPAPTAAAGAVPAVVSALLDSDIYQKRHKLLGRSSLPDDRVSALLSALVDAGGRARVETVAAEAGIPAHRINLTITALRRLLQVEGYPVLDIDPDGQTLVLDERLLREQFQLGSAP